jgi:hypothetical protein
MCDYSYRRFKEMMDIHRGDTFLHRRRYEQLLDKAVG